MKMDCNYQSIDTKNISHTMKIIHRRKKGVGFNVASNSLGHIPKLDRNPDLERNSLFFTNNPKPWDPRGIFDLQKDHKQTSITLHIYIIYIATRLICLWGSSGDSNSKLGSQAS